MASDEARADGVYTRADGAELSWTVRKLSQWDIRLKGRTIDSPLFRIEFLGKCSWYLKLSPRGEIEGDGHLHVYLVLFAGELRGKINCEMSFMFDEECISSGTVEGQTIGSRKFIKLSPCLMQEDVFQDKNKLFLKNDALNIRCRIWRSKILFIEHISFITEVFSERKSFQWTIKCFSQLELRSSVYHHESFFLYKTWFAGINLRLSLVGVTLDDCLVQFTLEASKNERLLIACELKIIKEIEEENKMVVVETMEIRNIFKQSIKVQTLNFPKSINRRVLLECLQNDVLTINGNITFITGDYNEAFTHYGPFQYSETTNPKHFGMKLSMSK